MSEFDDFIIADDFARYGIRAGVTQSSPSFLQIELTDRCNLSCASCPRAAHASSGYVFELDVFERMLQELPRLQHVSFVGAGEALFVDSFPSYIGLCTARGIKTSTVSNGLLIPSRLNAAIRAGLSKVGISIDAADDALLRGIRSGLALSALGRSIRSAVALCGGTSTSVFGAATLSSATVPHLSSIFNFAADCGLLEISVESIHHWGDDKRLNGQSLFSGDAAMIVSHIEAGLELAARRGLHVSIFDYKRLLRPSDFRDCHCPWPWDAMFLTCRGEVTPCCVNIEASERNALGNVKTVGIDGIWVGDRYREFRDSFGTDREWDSCRECVYRMEFGEPKRTHDRTR